MGSKVYAPRTQYIIVSTSLDKASIMYDAATDSIKISAPAGTPLKTDPQDRAARLLGIVYGNQGQLQQRAGSLDLFAQLRNGGTEIDPRDVLDRAARALGQASITDASGKLLTLLPLPNGTYGLKTREPYEFDIEPTAVATSEGKIVAVDCYVKYMAALNTTGAPITLTVRDNQATPKVYVPGKTIGGNDLVQLISSPKPILFRQGIKAVASADGAFLLLSGHTGAA